MNLTPPSPVDGTAWTPARVRWVILAISIAAGLLATIDGPQPTGGHRPDVVLVALAVAGITWLGSAALRWDAALVTVLASVTSMSPIALIFGIVTATVGFVLPIKPGRRGVLNALLIGAAFNIVARSELGVFFGASTLIGLLLAAYIGAIGFARRSRRSRRIFLGVTGAIVAATGVATAAIGVFGYLAADDLRQGNTQVEAGLAALGTGDIDTAKTSFDAASASFDAADKRLDMPLVAAARYVPILAQHHRLATQLSATAADASRFFSSELQRLDLDKLSVTNGRIDIEEVTALQAPLLAVQLRIEALQSEIIELDTPWLIGPVSDRIDRLADKLAAQHRRSYDALSVAIAAPALLGADEPRTYFIGFTTPAEARGSGGFMGNWAEVTITAGRIEMTGFGRADDLNLAGDPATRRFSRAADGSTADLDEWLNRYGPFNLTSGPDGTTGHAPWKNINMSPDIATTGRAIADLYPKSGGGELDGVFIMDVYTLARFLEFTGPIPLPDGQLVDGQPTVTADTAAKFLLNEQYDLTKVDARVDALEEFSRSVIDTLLTGTLPPPTTLLSTLGPMVDQGRLAGWAARPDEQAVLDQIGLAGTLSTTDTGDAVAITFNNAVGNKIDYFLDAAATYRVRSYASTGTATAELELTMTNSAPESGEPGYVIGNQIGLPVGTNRTWVSFYTRLPVERATIDGEELLTETSTEAGYIVTSAYVTLPAGASATLQLSLSGPLQTTDGFRLSARTPPTVAPTPLTIRATWVDRQGRAQHVRDELLDAGSHIVSLVATP